MQTIGLIGGMSWESTVPYYRFINEAVKRRLGSLHFAQIVLVSVDFQEIQSTGDWTAAARAAGIPLLHVVDVLAEDIKRRGIRRVGLLGTRFTMEQEFYRARLADNGLEAAIPGLAGRNTVHRVIYEELCLGQVHDSSRLAYRDIIQRLVDEGADGIVLGRTEIAMLIGLRDSPVLIFDTLEIHVHAAVEYALRDARVSFNKTC